MIYILISKHFRISTIIFGTLLVPSQTKVYIYLIHVPTLYCVSPKSICQYLRVEMKSQFTFQAVNLVRTSFLL